MRFDRVTNRQKKPTAALWNEWQCVGINAGAKVGVLFIFRFGLEYECHTR